MWGKKKSKNWSPWKRNTDWEALFIHWPVRIKAFPFLAPFGSLKVVNYLKGKELTGPAALEHGNTRTGSENVQVAWVWEKERGRDRGRLWLVKLKGKRGKQFTQGAREHSTRSGCNYAFPKIARLGFERIPFLCGSLQEEEAACPPT